MNNLIIQPLTLALLLGSALAATSLPTNDGGSSQKKSYQTPRRYRLRSSTSDTRFATTQQLPINEKREGHRLSSKEKEENEHLKDHRKMAYCQRTFKLIEKGSNPTDIEIDYRAYKKVMNELYEGNKITFSFFYGSFCKLCSILYEKKLFNLAIRTGEEALSSLFFTFTKRKSNLSCEQINWMNFLKQHEQNKVPLSCYPINLEKNFYEKHRMSKELFFNLSSTVLYHLALNLYMTKCWSKSSAYAKKYMELCRSFPIEDDMAFLEMAYLLVNIGQVTLEKKRIKYADHLAIKNYTNLLKKVSKKLNKKKYTYEADRVLLKIKRSFNRGYLPR